MNVAEYSREEDLSDLKICGWSLKALRGGLRSDGSHTISKVLWAFFLGQQTESFERGFNDRNQEPYGCKKVTRILNFPTDRELSQLK